MIIDELLSSIEGGEVLRVRYYACKIKPKSLREAAVSEALLFALNSSETTSDIIRTLMHAGADVCIADNDMNTPLHIAAYRGNTEFANTLICRQEQLDKVNKYGKSSLHIAVQDLNFDLVNVLVHKGANLNMQDFLGNTPLIYAVKHSSVYLVKYLVECEARTDLANNEGKTAFELAQEKNNKKMLKYLFR